MDHIASLTSVSSDKVYEQLKNFGVDTSTANEDSFETLYNSAVTLITETNSLQDAAETEEINFALGYSDDTHTLQIAEEKANIALQYTIAVRDRFLEAYDTIMQMQV
ncbi:MAG: flagellar hook-basal body complex protein FliE [Eubacterium sp.]|nr:flagellar hook-basal body complex protein FliE [Eubacterium sp.]